jgi:signal transduction histidine kinase
MGANSSILLLGLIEDILDLAKIEAGTFSLNITSFMIPTLLDDISEIFEYQCKQKHLEFSIKQDSCLKKLPLKSDQGRIKQILMNLISNSLKFTFNGSIKIRVKLITRDDMKYAQFWVSDTGVGIPKKEQKKLFKLFGMLDLNKEMNRNGWGIGLTISKKYVEALGGVIWLESEHNHGTTFFFTVPYPEKEYNIEDSIDLWFISDEMKNSVEFIVEDNINKVMCLKIKESKLENASRNKLVDSKGNK